MLIGLRRFLGRLLLLALVVTTFVFSAYFSFSWFVRRGVVAVPELAGLSEEAARSLLADLGLEAARADPAERTSETVPAGRVLESRPARGSLVKRGARVSYVISKGPLRSLVPDLRGRAVEAARIQLRAAGLEPGSVLLAFRPGAAPGSVFGQAPRAGMEVASGTPVDLLVAQEGGPELVRMPDLVARRYEPVRNALERLGFRLGNVRFERYEGIPPGTILQQQPPAGFPMTRRTPIRLVVAGEKTA